MHENTKSITISVGESEYAIWATWRTRCKRRKVSISAPITEFLKREMAADPYNIEDLAYDLKKNINDTLTMLKLAGFVSEDKVNN